MKSVDGYDKLRGGYYTPAPISDFLVQWAVRSPNDRILEPSCGDGSFLRAIAQQMTALGASPDQLRRQVTGVELDKNEAKKSRQYGARVVNQDFFTYYDTHIDGKTPYDAIVGNPPFIRYQNFVEDYRRTAFSLMERHGFHPNRLTNIWLPFLLLACKALKPGGRVGMVIPAELFQVNYAAEARLFLSSYLESLNLVTFQSLVFDGIQQEVILLLGERTSQRSGIRVVELQNLDELVSRGTDCFADAEVKRLDHSQDKWSKYHLTQEELSLLDRLNADPRISNAKDLFEVNVGLVSGENTFFVVNQETARQWDISDCITPIISRSEQLRGVILSPEEYQTLSDSGKKVWFFAPGNTPMDALSTGAQAYIRHGEEQGYPRNYKCRVRPVWYHVPQSWTADAFLIRQANLYPKMVLNQPGALVTDTLHKVRFLEGVDGPSVVAAFLNTYTFALSETLGRSYGGGVLTFEPSEMRRMRIPMRYAEQLDLSKIDQWQRAGDYPRILAYTDDILLRQGLGLSAHEIALLHDIWARMRDRRLTRKAQRT